MDINRFAPPKAEVEGAPLGSTAAPPLWNPNAAANWSLLFTPVFGSWLHWRNWQALGETQHATKARHWFIAAIVAMVGSAVVALSVTTRVADLTSRAVSIGFLIVWYYAAAKPQVSFIKARYGHAYARKGWLVPILVAIGLCIAFTAGAVLLALLLGARA